MKVSEALAVVGGYTADQWGMVTTAQAVARGVGSVTLYRLVDAGHLEPVRRGVYALVAAPVSAYRDVQAAWLSLNPSVPAWRRPRLDPDGGVVSHRSAALLHGLGDMLAERIVLTVPRRRSSRDPFVQLRQRALGDTEVTLVDGLPVTTVVRTIEDLLAEHVDGSHVAAAMKDGVQAGMLNLSDLDGRVGCYARRYGVKGRAGERLVDHLLDQIGTTRSALTQAPGTVTEPRQQFSLLGAGLREALGRDRPLHSPALRQQLSSLTGMQAVLEGIAEHITKPQQAALAALADEVRKPQQASVQAGLAAMASQLQVRPSADADSDEQR